MPDSCATCFYFRTDGTCRFNAPFLFPGSGGRWPAVNPTDWCAEFNTQAKVQGPKGDPGTPGAPGTPGSQWTWADAPPAASVGNNGDFWIERSPAIPGAVLKIHAKVGGFWSIIGDKFFNQTSGGV